MATFYWRGGTATWSGASTANWASVTTACKFTASRATTVLTVTAVASGTITNGDSVWHTNGTLIGIITSFGTGTGGVGTYNMDTSGTVTSRSMVSATIGAGPSAATDDVVFDSNSNVGTATFTVTNSSSVCHDITASGLAGAMTLSGSGLTVSGSWDTPASNFTFTAGSGAVTFNSTTAETIQTNDVDWAGASLSVVFNGAGGSWQLLSDLHPIGSATLTAGTLDLNGFTLESTTWLSNNSNTRAVAFGSGGKLELRSSGTTIVSMATMTGFTYTGTPDVESTYAGGTGTRTFTQGPTGASSANALPVRVTGGTDTLSGICGGGLDLTGFAGTWGNGSRTFYGSLTLDAAMTPGAQSVTFAGTAGTQVFQPDGLTLTGWNIEINGVGGTMQLAGNVTVTTGGDLDLTNGTLDLNGFTFTTGSVEVLAGTKNITWNGGTIVVLDATGTGGIIPVFQNTNPTNFTSTKGSACGVISMTNATAKTFAGGGSTYHAALNQGGAGDLTITGSNTFCDMTNTVNSTSILFTAATTTTFTDGFSVNDSTITSVTAANHNLSMASGTVNVSNNTISRSQAAGGATWNSYTSNGNVDGGNNSGWIFSAPVGGGNFLPLFL